MSVEEINRNIDEEIVEDDNYEDEYEDIEIVIDEDTNKMLDIIKEALEEKKCENIEVINTAGTTALFDYMVLANVISTKQSSSVIDEVKKSLREKGYDIKNIEGDISSNWVIIDAYSIIVHLMTEELREYYKLEELWKEQ